MMVTSMATHKIFVEIKMAGEKMRTGLECLKTIVTNYDFRLESFIFHNIFFTITVKMKFKLRLLQRNCN